MEEIREAKTYISSRGSQLRYEGMRHLFLDLQCDYFLELLVYETLLFVVIYDLIIVLYVSLYGTLFHYCFCLFTYSLLCSPVYHPLSLLFLVCLVI